ncbi:hypothetical protein KL930_003933 [Ogataea haglerorum]|uniref:Uncharacterized protein n=1 Tax=Ogataea haglerorum TaxID=1937702 RepID=A0AAN6D3D8_9ASCO|nr:uncharacterized protein KL911_004072 [Ogataea haglerorum]KAG7694613.1 hypothetical protein KL915_003580 [Ogataea haglerorum]KAG7695186.1 hypothetical protein KL951_003628 [Ogataea haglerorum]KAG7705051.1 hypothetical protein KL914_003737 [Ogataea haglerorum]KAG7705309.1 hypothetical protein KL950_003745 [Ogataea haglerorum]KAG7716823.1 hypothetical protein KL913_003339 [Ogataea haglerorum]
MMESGCRHYSRYDPFDTSIKDLEQIFNFRIQLFDTRKSLGNELDSDLNVWLKKAHSAGKSKHLSPPATESSKRRRLDTTTTTCTFLDDFELFRYRDEIQELREEVISVHYQQYIGLPTKPVSHKKHHEESRMERG